MMMDTLQRMSSAAQKNRHVEQATRPGPIRAAMLVVGIAAGVYLASAEVVVVDIAALHGLVHGGGWREISEAEAMRA